MSLHERCASGHGMRDGELTGGEARTLAAFIHGIEPEEVDSFVLVTYTHCSVCGRHTVLMEKDMTHQMAVTTLGNAIGAIILAGEDEEE